MFSIIRSLVVITAVLAASGGATYSYFSASDSIFGNTISTAVVEFDVEGESSTGALAKPLVASDLVPGQFTPWARAALKNESVFPVRIYMYVDNLGGSLCPLTNLTVTTGESGSDASERSRVVYSGNILDMAGGAERVEVTGVPPGATLAGDATQHIQQRAQLDESAGNGAQDQKCTWEEFFVAESVAPEEEE